MKNEHLIVDGVDVHFTDRGTGAVVLLLHGWGDTLSTFDALISALGNKRFIAVDLPGFGGSELPTTSWDVSQYVQFVRHFLDKLSINQPDILVGHSFGGRVAIKGVANQIIRPNKLVLIASAGVAIRNTARQGVFSILAKTGKFLTSIPPFSLLRESLKSQLYKLTGSTDYLKAGPMKETFLKVVREDLLVDAEKIKTPTLLVWGKDDTETTIAEAHILEKAITNSNLTIIPGAGHFVHREMPEEVAEKIKIFIAT